MLSLTIDRGTKLESVVSFAKDRNGKNLCYLRIGTLVEMIGYTRYDQIEYSIIL